jgi:hypothetical protein
MDNKPADQKKQVEDDIPDDLLEQALDDFDKKDPLNITADEKDDDGSLFIQ